MSTIYGEGYVADRTSSGETMAQREEVCAAWHALPDELRKDQRLTRLYHALGGPRMEDPAEAVPPGVGVDRHQTFPQDTPTGKGPQP